MTARILYVQYEMHAVLFYIFISLRKKLSTHTQNPSQQRFPNHPTPNKYDPLAIKKKTTRAENGIQSTGFHCRGHRPRTHMPRTAVSTQEFVSIAVAEYLAGPRTQSARQSPIEEGQTNLSV